MTSAPLAPGLEYAAKAMAGQKSKRRKRRNSPSGTRAVRSARREQQEAQQAQAIRERQSERRDRRTPGAVGERPPSPFGRLPVSEIAIFAGLVGLMVGLGSGNTVALLVGAVVCALGVAEVSAREHLSGFRSHTTLLAAIPAVLVEILIAVVLGVPKLRFLILLPPIPVFALCFWLLRGRFRVARQRRVAKTGRR